MTLNVKKAWLGQVQSINTNFHTFKAIIRNRINIEKPKEDITLSIDDLSERDIPKLQVGAIFAIADGVTINRDGAKFLESIVYFTKPTGFEMLYKGKKWR